MLRSSAENPQGVPHDFNEEVYLQLNEDVASAVSKGAFRSGAHHWMLHGRHEVRPMRIRSHRSSAPQAPVKWIGVGLAEGETRDCLDPWSYMQIKATGEVSPCCAHPPIGRITDENDLEAVVAGKQLQFLQLGLLVGQLNAYCGRCSIKGPTSIEALRRRLAKHQIEWNKLPLDGDGNALLDANNAISGWIRFLDVDDGRFAFKDTITLYARETSRPAPTIVFENLRWRSGSLVDIFASVPEASGCMRCRLLAGSSADMMRVLHECTVYRGETVNIVTEMPQDFDGGCLAIGVQKYFADDSADSVVSLTLPVLRERVAGS